MNQLRLPAGILLLDLLLTPSAEAQEAVDTDRGIYRDLIRGVESCVVGIRSSRRGTGVVISSDGLILTSSTLTDPSQGEGEGLLEVVFPGGRVHQAAMVGQDELTGVALLRIHSDGLAHLPLDGDLPDLHPGETILTFTNATGSIQQDYQVSASVGVVHSRLRLLGEGKQVGALLEIQAAATNPQNVGGPVVDVQGRLRGLLNEKGLHRVGTFLGTAVPVRRVAVALQRIETDEAPRQSYVGGRLHHRQVKEVVVLEVPEGSPLAQAGLEVGDVILEAAGERLTDQMQFHQLVGVAPPGTAIPLLVRRRGQLREVNLVTGEAPPEGYLGVEWTDDDKTGLRVASVAEDSPVRRQRGRRSRHHLQTEDRVLRINDILVDDLDDLEKMRSQLYEGAEVRITFRRGRVSHILDLSLPPEPAPAPEEAATIAEEAEGEEELEESRPEESPPEGPGPGSGGK